MRLQEQGGDALAFQCDVTGNACVESTFSQMEPHGPIDALINCAGVAHIGTIANLASVAATVGIASPLCLLNEQGGGIGDDPLGSEGLH